MADASNHKSGMDGWIKDGWMDGSGINQGWIRNGSDMDGWIKDRWMDQG